MNKFFFTNNRKKLCNQIENHSIVVLFAGEPVQRTSDQCYPFTPNRNYYYITGIEKEKTACLITKFNGKTETYLFIERRDSHREKFEGKMLEPEEATEISGIVNVLYIDELEKKIARLLESNICKIAYLDLERRRNWSAALNPSQVFAASITKKYPHLNIENIYHDLCEMRVIKTEGEIERIKKAVEITNLGVRNMMKHARPGMMEYELEAYFDFTLKSHGVKAFAFNTIAAAGANAVTLHYEKNNAPIGENDMILFDLGAEYKYYASDISRTFPVSGKFTERQKVLYNIVLKASDEVIKLLKPGTPHEDITKTHKKVVTEECKKIGLIKEDVEIDKYFLHGSGHYIGLDTHDVGTTEGVTLKPNMVLTIEPGLYFKDESIGIRIEDVFLITEDGHEFISKDIPRTVKEIEEFMKK